MSNQLELTDGAGVAIVHEWLVRRGGSERVVEALLHLHRHAPVFALVYRPQAFTGSIIGESHVSTSFIQRLPLAARHYAAYLPLMPVAIEQFDCSNVHTIISSHHAVAKGVITRADQLHISYVHSPMRYAWDLHHQYLRDARLGHGPRSWAARQMLHSIRQWDVATANRVDLFVANSRHVAARIWRTYRRPARILYPPVDVSSFNPHRPREEFYVAFSRLVPYKRIDIIVEAFNRLKRPLIVLGDGPERRHLVRIAGPHVTFKGWQPDLVVRDYLERARALVFAAEEDFGIIPVEAQAAGCPVIAFGRGGNLETVVPGVTGVLFQNQSVASVMAGVKAFESGPAMDSQAIRSNAERFSIERFEHGWSQIYVAAQALRGSPAKLETELALEPPAGTT